MHKQMTAYFEKNRIIYNSQYGFRNKHSTQLAAIELTDRIIDSLDKKLIPFNV